MSFVHSVGFWYLSSMSKKNPFIVCERLTPTCAKYFYLIGGSLAEFSLGNVHSWGFRTRFIRAGHKFTFTISRLSLLADIATMALPLKKRKISTQGGRPTLTKQVAKLTRQVNSNKPELRQISYTVTVDDGAAACLKPPALAGEEFKLHGIVLRWVSAGPDSDQGWARLISPKGQYTMDDYNSKGYNDRMFEDPDKTKYRNWAVKYFNTAGEAFSRQRSIQKKFSIPMICGTDGDALNPTVIRNQMYVDMEDSEPGGNPKVLIATMYFTDA